MMAPRTIVTTAVSASAMLFAVGVAVATASSVTSATDLPIGRRAASTRSNSQVLGNDVTPPSPDAALSLSPVEALPWLLSGLACAVLITQFFEFAVVSTIHRLQWAPNESISELSVLFYQLYWAAMIALLLTSTLWIYLTDRWMLKTLYGLVAFVVVQALQLSLAILLTSWKDMSDGLQSKMEHPWLQTLLGRAVATTRRVSG